MMDLTGGPMVHSDYGRFTNVSWFIHGRRCEPNRNYVEYIGFYHFRMHMTLGTAREFNYLIRKAMEGKHVSPDA